MKNIFDQPIDFTREEEHVSPILHNDYSQTRLALAVMVLLDQIIGSDRGLHAPALRLRQHYKTLLGVRS